MEEDFELIINDDVYHVKTPELERPSQVRDEVLTGTASYVHTSRRTSGAAGEG